MIRKLAKYDHSRFWARLDSLAMDRNLGADTSSLDHLRASIRKVAEQAAWISTQICRFMPQYTLHEERHFLNVLGIMEALVPDDVIERMTPLECALPILGAYTHDLGMALSQDEYDSLQDEATHQGKRFASHRSRFGEELQQINRWNRRLADLLSRSDVKSKRSAAEAQRRVAAIEGHILASYLRDTHTDDGHVSRLRRWLEAIKAETGDANLFSYGNFNYQRTLTLLGVSHGRGAPWLRRQLIDGGQEDRFYQPVGTGESANLAYPGLLLRLADVMDFDASRCATDPLQALRHRGRAQRLRMEQASVGLRLAT